MIKIHPNDKSIGSSFNLGDKKATMYHELIERYIMKKYNMDYEPAHQLATKLEYEMRKLRA